MHYSLRLFLALVFLLASAASAQVLVPISAQEPLSQVSAKAQAELGSNAVPTHVIFLQLEYQGVALAFDAQTGKATGWLYRWYAPSLDSTAYYIAIKAPVVGITVIGVPVDTITNALPFNTGVSMLMDPWVDSPAALAGSMSGGAGAFHAAHADARVSLAVLVNNPVQNPVLPVGEYWMFVHTAISDTLSCLVYAETGNPLRCVSSNAPKITSMPRTVARVDEVYMYDIEARGEPDPHFSLTVKPAGMNIDSISGLISWTPTAQQVGVVNVTVRASNSSGLDQQSFQIAVEGAASAPKFTSLPLLEARAGDMYQYTLSASGSPRPVFQLVSGPAGFNVDGGRGIASWATSRANAGEHAVAIAARNAAGADTQRYVLVVTAEPRLNSFVNKTVPIGQTLSVTASAEGYPLPRYGLVIAPVGMVIDSITGLLTWTPTAQQKGVHNVVVEARNRVGFHPQGFTVQVDDATAVESAPASILLRITAVYPQPITGARSPLIAELHTNRSGILRMDIADVLGRIMWSNVRAISSPGQIVFHIDEAFSDAERMPAGIYMLRVHMGDAQTQRLIEVIR